MMGGRKEVTLKKLRSLMRIMGTAGIILVLIIIASDALPIISNTNSISIFHLVARQRALEERLVKDTLLLTYRSSTDEAEAVSEMQTALPLWEKVQNGLYSGDPSLGMPQRLPSDLKLLIVQAQPDFFYLDSAFHHILAHPNPVDPVQLTIVLQHNQSYYLAMEQVVNNAQDHIQEGAKIYFSIELIIALIALIIALTFLIIADRTLGKMIAKDKELLEKEE